MIELLPIEDKTGNKILINMEMFVGVVQTSEEDIIVMTLSENIPLNMPIKEFYFEIVKFYEDRNKI